MTETLDVREIQGTIEPKARPCPPYYMLPPVTEIGLLAERMSYHAGTAFVYIWRAMMGKPGNDPAEDIRKAIDHLCMERDRLKNLPKRY